MTKSILPVYNAYDRNLIGEIRTHDAAELEAMISWAAKTFEKKASWLKLHQRIAILNRLAEMVNREKDDFARLIAQEGGKPISDAMAEATRAVDGIKSAAEILRTLSGREIPMGLTPASEGRWAFTTHEPIGVVAAISAFNHPLNLIVHQVVPAIAAGCPVIVKPAATTPLCCSRLVALVHEAGLPPAWCQIFITNDNALAEKLATDPRIAFLSFIGSANVGWYLRTRLGPGTRYALEHGGVAPSFVSQNVDLDKIIEPMVKGGYYHAGQVCLSTQRIFVHDRTYDAFVEQFTARVSTLNVGNPLWHETEVGPLILPRETDRVENWVKEAVDDGARIATGGNRISSTTYAPTVLLEPSQKVKVSTQEIFGPVTCIYRYADLDTAIEKANSVPFAFQASVFSDDIHVALYVAEHVNAGSVIVNDHTAFRTDWMPFAGLRHSGYGIGGIEYTMKDMMYSKMIVLNRK